MLRDFSYYPLFNLYKPVLEDLYVKYREDAETQKIVCLRKELYEGAYYNVGKNLSLKGSLTIEFFEPDEYSFVFTKLESSNRWFVETLEFDNPRGWRIVGLRSNNANILYKMMQAYILKNKNIYAISQPSSIV